MSESYHKHLHKKYSIVICLQTLTLLLSLPVFATDISQALQQLGFTQYNLVDYKKIDNKEYFTFSDWTTEEKGDTITFVIENGKVIKKFKEEEGG